MRLLIALVVSLFMASAAHAQGLGVEVRGGAALSGYATPDAVFDPFTNGRLEDVTATLIWHPPINPLFLLASPSAELGIASDLFDTSSLVHANLVWQAFVPLSPVYLEAGLGAATALGGTTAGCPVLGYARAGVGVVVRDTFTVTVGVDHADDLGFCGRGGYQQTSIGVQLGLRF